MVQPSITSSDTVSVHNDDELIIHLSCHCQSFTHTIILPRSVLPLKSSLCHCRSCRHVTGQIVASFGVIPLPWSQRPSTKGLVAYDSSEKMTRWFCETCGARCLNDDRTFGDKDGVGQGWEWEIPTGIIDGNLKGLLNRVQMWVEDTGDGGASLWLNAGELEGMDRRLTGRDSQILSDEELKAMVRKHRAGTPNRTGSSECNLTAHCHCRNIELSIKRKPDGGKWAAGLDACTSCRKASGFEITAWATVDLDCVGFDLNSNCLGRYSSSEGVVRLFCKTCGASVAYKKDDRDTVDLSAGILDAEEGVRAGTWLDWNAKYSSPVYFMEDAIDKELVDRLAAGHAKDAQ